MIDPLYLICAAILLVVIGREVYEDYVEQRRTKMIVGLVIAAIVAALGLLFGFGWIWRIAR